MTSRKAIARKALAGDIYVIHAFIYLDLPASGFWKKDCTNFVMADHCSDVGEDIV